MADAPTSTRVCHFCGASNFSDAAFCNRCGFKLLELCPLCESKNPFEAVTCSHCGAPLTAAREHLSHLRRRLRRYSAQVTLILAGIFFLLVLVFLYWWLLAKMISQTWLRFLPLFALILIFFVLLLALFSAYYNWKEAKKEERHLDRSPRKRKIKI